MVNLLFRINSEKPASCTWYKFTTTCFGSRKPLSGSHSNVLNLANYGKICISVEINYVVIKSQTSQIYICMKVQNDLAYIVLLIWIQYCMFYTAPLAYFIILNFYLIYSIILLSILLYRVAHEKPARRLVEQRGRRSRTLCRKLNKCKCKVLTG
jgi:hypothetical protein